MVGKLVRETIQLRRSYDCKHEWTRINEKEEQCSRCGVIVTEEGKKNLERMASAFHGKLLVCPW
jgi:ribosomal protein S27AE